jgi:ABC-type transport system involved in multi-copper enzyme maturation permease subunit
MVGAVVRHEMLLAGRRLPLRVLRWVYASWLLLQVVFLFLALQVEVATRPTGRKAAPASHAEVVAARFTEAFLPQQALLLALITPALVASSITEEKRRGTLQLLLLTEMRPYHLVLGKLLGRAWQVVLILLVGLPLFAMMAGLAGVSPASLALVLGSLVPPLVGLASLTLLAAAWLRHTRDAVLAVYVALLAGMAAATWLGGPLRVLNPLFVIDPAWGGAGKVEASEGLSRLGQSALMWGSLSAACLALTAWRLGSARASEVDDPRRRGPQWLSEEREAISDRPIFWRELHVEGLAPYPLVRRIPRWLAVTLVAVASAASSLWILGRSLKPQASLNDLCRALLSLNTREAAALLPEAHTGFLLQSVAVMLLFSLAVGVRCSAAVAGERESHTWEALLLTPQTAQQIILGKLWGVMMASMGYLLAYAGPALALSIVAGPLAFTHTLLWLGVTVLVMYFLGAAGLWASVYSSTSWRALLRTLLVGYVGGLALYAVTTPAIGLLTGVLILAFFLIDLVALTSLAPMCLRNQASLLQLFWVGSALGLAALSLLLAHIFLGRAIRWVAEQDRTRHWDDDPHYRRSPHALLGPPG